MSPLWIPFLIILILTGGVLFLFWLLSHGESDY